MNLVFAEYYFNINTNESVWETPPELLSLAAAASSAKRSGATMPAANSPNLTASMSAAAAKAQLERSVVWEECKGPNGLPYYFNIASQVREMFGFEDDENETKKTFPCSCDVFYLSVVFK